MVGLFRSGRWAVIVDRRTIVYLFVRLCTSLSEVVCIQGFSQYFRCTMRPLQIEWLMGLGVHSVALLSSSSLASSPPMPPPPPPTHIFVIVDLLFYILKSIQNDSFTMFSIPCQFSWSMQMEHVVNIRKKHVYVPIKSNTCYFVGWKSYST